MSPVNSDVEYLYDSSNNTFIVSQEFCRQQNAQIVTVTDLKSQLHIVSEYLNNGQLNLSTWLNAKQSERNSSDFYWNFDLTKVVEVPWANGQPDDLDHDCVALVLSFNSHWYDYKCTDKSPVLCQRFMSSNSREQNGTMARSMMAMLPTILSIICACLGAVIGFTIFEIFKRMIEKDSSC